MTDWRKSLYECLKDFDAPRLLSNTELQTFASNNGIDVSPRQIQIFIERMKELDILSPVRRGLYLNNRAWPAPTYAEAANRIRAGSVVSLLTVLGDAGVMNNSTSNIYSVLPASEGTEPYLAPVMSEDVNFYFSRMKREILEAGDPNDRLVPMLPYKRATPEAAIVHWLYLANTRRSALKEPDTQCDVELLDLDRLRRLARASALESEVFSWIDRCRKRGEDDDNHTHWGPARSL